MEVSRCSYIPIWSGTSLYDCQLFLRGANMSRGNVLLTLAPLKKEQSSPYHIPIPQPSTPDNYSAQGFYSAACHCNTKVPSIENQQPSLVDFKKSLPLLFLVSFSCSIPCQHPLSCWIASWWLTTQPWRQQWISRPVIYLDKFLFLFCCPLWLLFPVWGCASLIWKETKHNTKAEISGFSCYLLSTSPLWGETS